jgi:hypothetical protein
MKKRTIAIGDIHGDLEQLSLLWSRLPELTRDDTAISSVITSIAGLTLVVSWNSSDSFPSILWRASSL